MYLHESSSVVIVLNNSVLLIANKHDI